MSGTKKPWRDFGSSSSSSSTTTQVAKGEKGDKGEPGKDGTGLPVIYGTVDPNGVVAGAMNQWYKNTVTGEAYVNKDGSVYGWI